MNIPCYLMEDLLPLYSEDLLSKESKQAVAKHLANCPDCQTKHQAMKSPTISSDIQPEIIPLKSVQTGLRRQKTNLVGLSICLIAFLTVWLFSWLSLPEYLPYSESLVKLTETTDGYMLAEVSSEATSVKLIRQSEPDVGMVTYLEAWTSRWDQWHKGSESMQYVLSSPEEPSKAFRYSDFSSREAPVIALSPQGNSPISGLAILPRLALNLYFQAALVGTALSLIVWLLARKSHWAWIPRMIFFAGISYLIAHLLIKGINGATFHLVRDFALISLSAALLFGTITFGYRWFKQ